MNLLQWKKLKSNIQNVKSKTRLVVWVVQLNSVYDFWDDSSSKVTLSLAKTLSLTREYYFTDSQIRKLLEYFELPTQYSLNS